MSNVQMMNQEMETFLHQEFGEVRTILEDGKLSFVGSDIAKALGYKNVSKALNDHCKGITKRYILTEGGKQEMSVIAEGDIYRLIVKSKLPAAEKFEKWLFEEVIPTIRKHGAYMTPDVIERTITNPDFLIQLATTLKQEQEARKIAEEANKVLILENTKKEAMLLEQAPKIEVYEDFISKEGLYSVNDIAKCFAIKGMGRNNLYKWLRNNRILFDGFQLYQRFINQRVGVQRTYKYIGRDNNEHTESNAYFTAKGVEYLHGKLKKDGYKCTKTVSDILCELNHIEFDDMQFTYN